MFCFTKQATGMGECSLGPLSCLTQCRDRSLEESSNISDKASDNGDADQMKCDVIPSKIK